MDAYLQHSARYAYEPDRDSSVNNRVLNNPPDQGYPPLPANYPDYTKSGPGTLGMALPFGQQMASDRSEDGSSTHQLYGHRQTPSQDDTVAFSPRPSNLLPIGEATTFTDNPNSTQYGRPLLGVLGVSVPLRVNSAQSSTFMGDPSLLYGSSLGRASDFSGDSYMLPSSFSQYLSPDNFDSFDTLRLPPASHLNSPPGATYPLSGGLFPRAISANYGGSFPTGIQGSSTSRFLSPPTTSASHFLSSLVPRNQHSTHTPVKPQLQPCDMDFSPSRDYSVTKDLSKADKLKRRREFHNVVERRRRDLIKDKIKELGAIVPPSLLNPMLAAVQLLSNENELEFEAGKYDELLSSIKVKETKPNKSKILDMTVTYMKHLQYVLQKQEMERVRLERQISELESQLVGADTGAGIVLNRESVPAAPINIDFPERESFDPDEFFSDILDDFRIVPEFP